VGQPLVQPHPQQKPPQPRAKRLNKNIPGKATTTPTPTPAPNKPPPATSAKVDADAGFTTVTHKKQKKRPTTLLPPPQPTADRKLIFKLMLAPTVPARTAAALRIVNKTIADHPDIAHPPCLSAHITQSNALVVIVAESYRSTDYDPYLGTLQEALQADKFPIAGSFVSERWTRFVLNGIPTDASPEDVQREIGSLYPSIRLGMYDVPAMAHHPRTKTRQDGLIDGDHGHRSTHHLEHRPLSALPLQQWLQPQRLHHLRSSHPLWQVPALRTSHPSVLRTTPSLWRVRPSPSHQTSPLRNSVLQKGPRLFSPASYVRLVSAASQGYQPHLSDFLTATYPGFVERKGGGSLDGSVVTFSLYHHITYWVMIAWKLVHGGFRSW
jgi:hypothetical protein